MSLPPGAQNMDQNAQEIAALVEDHEAQSWLAFARAAAAQPDNPMGAVAGGFIQKALGPDAFLVPAALSASLAVAV